MSYDLYFCATDDRQPLTLSDLRAFFGARPHYQMNPGQAWYQNEDTHVYFSFEHSDDDGTVEPHPARYSNVMFNMNFLRPHVFALEAEPEVRAFVEAFELAVDDPQEGMNGGT